MRPDYGASLMAHPGLSCVIPRTEPRWVGCQGLCWCCSQDGVGIGWLIRRVTLPRVDRIGAHDNAQEEELNLTDLTAPL